MRRQRNNTPEIIERARLLDLIDGPKPAPIILIAAPAGYGKTTAAQQWLAHHPEFRCGWFQVGTEHNKPDRFLHRLWQIVDAALGEARPAPPEIAIEHILERISACPDPFVLVFDVYTQIHNAAIHQLMHRLFGAIPDTARIMLLTRQIPAIPIARLRAKERLRHITQDDLAFTLDEVQHLFADRAFEPDTIVRLTAQTRGWIIALLLAAADIEHAPSDDPDSLEKILAMLPTNRTLADYIAEEVLAYLPDDLLSFVLDTSVFTELDPALCNAVLQINTADAFLKRLEDSLLFVARSAIHPSTLVYHPLFAESVQWLRGRRFNLALSNAELRLRAAQWYRDRGDLTEAANFALAAQDWPLVSELLSALLVPSVGYQHDWKAFHWLDQLGQIPEQVFRTNIPLFQAYCSALLINGFIRRARSAIESFPFDDGAELTPGQRGWHALQRATLASADGDWAETLAQGYRSLGFLPESDLVGRLFGWSFLYIEEAARGNREIARGALQQAEINRNRQPHESTAWHFHLQPAIANDRAMQGDLSGAETLLHHFIQNAPADTNESLSKFRKGLLAIELEQNRLDLAARSALALEADLRPRVFSSWHVETLIALARYDFAVGNAERAHQHLDQAMHSSRLYGGKADIAHARNAMAWYWLEMGQDSLFALWFSTTMLPSGLAHRFGEIEPRLLHLRWLVQQEQFRDAVELLTESLVLARATSNRSAEIAFLVWSAIVSRATGDLVTASDTLRNALERAAPGGFHRTFTATGADLSGLIRSLAPKLSEPARVHAASLLGPDGIAQSGNNYVPQDGAGLTPREREVLKELMLGKSNRDIAKSLFITERTVKKHLANVFTKTGTSNRSAAAVWGRAHIGG